MPFNRAGAGLGASFWTSASGSFLALSPLRSSCSLWPPGQHCHLRTQGPFSGYRNGGGGAKSHFWSRAWGWSWPSLCLSSFRGREKWASWDAGLVRGARLDGNEEGTLRSSVRSGQWVEAETSPYRGRGSSVSTVSTSLGLCSLCPFVTEEEGVGQEPVNSSCPGHLIVLAIPGARVQEECRGGTWSHSKRRMPQSQQC